MIRILGFVAVVWLALMPPLFTDGACTAEFDREASQLTVNQKALDSPAHAQEYWSSRQVPVSVISAKQCRRARPRFVDACSSGDIVFASVPVQSHVCRVYRDSEIRIQLHYDDRNRLSRMVTDMNPFRALPLPWVDVMLYWGR